MKNYYGIYMKKIFMFLFFGCIITSAFADAPVVDYSSSSDIGLGTAKSFPMKTEEKISSPRAVASNAGFSAEQRIGKLEQQIDNINEQNFSSKVEQLQQQLQKLNGDLEEKNHQIEQLNTQLKGFYQDLNQRLEAGKGTTVPSSVSPAVVPASSSLVNASQINPTVSTVQNAGVVPATTTNVAGVFSGVEKKNDALKQINADTAFLKEQQMYQAAIDSLPGKEYESTKSRLRDYLKLYPKGAYVANAHYWIGEANYQQKNFDAAEEEFKIVVDKYATWKRVSDAMLKLALVHQNQGREAQAKQELRQLIKRYPGKPAAQLAKKQLAGT